MDLKTIEHIERVLRASIWEEELELDPTVLPARDSITKMYSELKSGHSFSCAARLARVKYLCDLFGVEFDPFAQPDARY